MSTIKRWKGVRYNELGEVISCRFCRIHNREQPGTIDYEDTNYVAFKTRAPITSLHLLITPRMHIQNVTSLKSVEGAKLLFNLKQIGKKVIFQELLKKYKIDNPTNLIRSSNHAEEIYDTIEKAQYCFHVPPYNSIDHIHLHAIAYPHEMTFLNWLKYYPSDYSVCNSVDRLIDKVSPNFIEDIVATSNMRLSPLTINKMNPVNGEENNNSVEINLSEVDLFPEDEIYNSSGNVVYTMLNRISNRPIH